jgi:hypothetical protein
MTAPEYVTTDLYLAAFLRHRGAVLTGLRRLGPKKVELRFEATPELHDLLRLYWSGVLTPVVPWELFMTLRQLKNDSINKYDPPRPDPPPAS